MSGYQNEYLGENNYRFNQNSNIYKKANLPIEKPKSLD